MATGSEYMERRTRAVDAALPNNGTWTIIDNMLREAMRVQITTEVVQAFLTAPDDPDNIAGPLAAAFRVAGFEVVE